MGETRHAGFTAVGGVKHLRGLGGGVLGGLLGGQLGPDFLPVIGAQLLQGNDAVCDAVDADAAQHWHRALAGLPLMHCWRAYTQLGG